MRKLLFIVLIAGTLLPLSCSKFENGPSVSFRSLEKRFEGEWLLKYFTVDGIDSLSFWNSFFGNECDFKFYGCENVYPYECIFEIHWGITDSVFYNVSGAHGGLRDAWLGPISFVEESNGSAFPLWFMAYPMPRDALVEWTITKLKYKEMWLEMDVNNKHYELHLDNVKKF